VPRKCRSTTLDKKTASARCGVSLPFVEQPDLRLAQVDVGRVDELAQLWVLANARRLSTQDTDADPTFVDRLRQRLAEPKAVVVAGFLGDRVVSSGFGDPLRDPDGNVLHEAAHVSLVAVSPDCWGRGLARRTLAFLEEQLAAFGYKRAELHVLATNERGRSLYDRSGWDLIRVGDEHPEGPQAVYAKALT
jgi:ribosomal protein S18 acetylase RimI-like enzyme